MKEEKTTFPLSKLDKKSFNSIKRKMANIDWNITIEYTKYVKITEKLKSQKDKIVRPLVLEYLSIGVQVDMSYASFKVTKIYKDTVHLKELTSGYRYIKHYNDFLEDNVRLPAKIEGFEL